MGTIPKDKPVILASNHPTAFLEPCLLAVLINRPLHFLTRGDFFANPVFRWFMTELNMIPIFRMRDGFGNVKNNHATFEICNRVLAENGMVLIFSEGKTLLEKRVRPIQKGTARLAFNFLDACPNQQDVYIVPVGVNYTYGDRFRSDVMVETGKPISVKSYLESYAGSQAAAVREVTEEIERRLKERVITIEKHEDEELTEFMLVMNRSHRPQTILPLFENDRLALRNEIETANVINHMTKNQKLILKRMAKAYFEKLGEVRVDDASVVQNAPGSILATLVLLLGFLPYAIGKLGNVLPVSIAGLVARRKVRFIEFYSPVALALGIGFTLIYYLLLLIAAFIFQIPLLFLLIPMLPFMGYFSLVYREYYQRWRSFQTWKNLDAKTRMNLQHQRNEIKEHFNAPTA